jgi:hypothetical protein
MNSKIVTLYLVVVGLIFFSFGMAYFIFPVTMIEFSGMKIPTATAKADTWAIYAGIQIGFGLFLLACSKKLELSEAGLLAIAFVFGGVAIGRTLGMLYFDAFDQYSLAALAFEWPGALISIWLLVKSKKTNIQPS